MEWLKLRIKPRSPDCWFGMLTSTLPPTAITESAILQSYTGQSKTLHVTDCAYGNLVMFLSSQQDDEWSEQTDLRFCAPNF